MHIVRTIIWVLLAVWALFFFGMNWGEPVPVKFWPIPGGKSLMFEWQVSLVAGIFFLIGLVPMWLLSRAQKWMLKRRIHSLEQAARHVAVVQPAPMADPFAETGTETMSATPLAAEDPPSFEKKPNLA